MLALSWSTRPRTAARRTHGFSDRARERPAQLGRLAAVGAVHDRSRGGGHAPRTGRLVAPAAQRRRAAAASARARRARERRDAPGSPPAVDRSAPDRPRGDRADRRAARLAARRARRPGAPRRDGGPAPRGLGARASGPAPVALGSAACVCPASRYQVILRTMADLARREPTFALHVHVGVPDPDRAIRLLNQMRAHVPLLLALSANSPFWQGRSTGLASTRTSVFGAFPRTGLPRRFHSYEDWVSTVDGLLRCGAFPEPTFLWWDIRPQPTLGTVEVRIMDAQTDPGATAALVALVQSLGPLALAAGHAPEGLVGAEELLAENRFPAARDGIEADLLDPVAELRRPARAQLRAVLDAARPHADELGCRAELERVAGVEREAPLPRPLEPAERRGRLPGLMAELTAAFVPDGL